MFLICCIVHLNSLEIRIHLDNNIHGMLKIIFLLVIFRSALPQDHPQRHQTLQPAAGRRRPHQDRWLWREQRVWGGGRPPVQHGGDPGLHGPWDDDRTGAGLQWKGETTRPLLVGWWPDRGRHQWITWGLTVTHSGAPPPPPSESFAELSCVCFPGVRRVGDGSHALLFCLREGKWVHSKTHVE